MQDRPTSKPTPGAVRCGWGEITDRAGRTWYRVTYRTAGMWARILGEWVELEYTGFSYVMAGRVYHTYRVK